MRLIPEAHCYHSVIDSATYVTCRHLIDSAHASLCLYTVLADVVSLSTMCQWGVIMEIVQKKLTLRVPPLKVTEGDILVPANSSPHGKMAVKPEREESQLIEALVQHPMLYTVLAGHFIWNSLPPAVQSSATLSVFCQRLKTHLFHKSLLICYYNCIL